VEGIFDELKMKKKKSIGYLNDNLMKEMSASEKCDPFI
jgi:hypothetical protein